MDKKDINMSGAFIFGIFSSMITTFLYSSIIISAYFIIISDTMKIFVYNITSILDIWVWIWLATSVLYGFSIPICIIVKNINKKNTHLIINIVFFIITLFLVLTAASYLPQIKFFDRKNDIFFYIFILSLLITFITIHLSLGIKFVLFNLNNFFMEMLNYNKVSFFEYDNDKNTLKEQEYSYELFFNTADNIISIAQRNKLSVGIIGFRVSNYLEILNQYGESVYNSVEKLVIKAIYEQARLGENQCLLQENTIYSILYANEEQAYKAALRYSNSLKRYTFEYGKELIPVSIVVAVSGIDFADKKITTNAAVIRDKLMWRIIDAIGEAQETQNPVIHYE